MSPIRTFARSTALAAVALCAPLALNARAQDAPLPKGETVLEEFIEATGGRAAYDKVKNRVSKGALEIAGAGLNGKIVITQARPNKMVTEVDLGQLGKTNQGTDGKLAWDVSALTGERLIEGEEKEEMLFRAIIDTELNPKENYKSVECVGVEDVEGKPAYKVVLTPKAGKSLTNYYDKASHLLVKTTSVAKSPMGEITVDTFPSDYKKVDGILMAMTAKQKMLTQEIVVKLSEVKHNVDLPADAFEVPEAVKELAKKKSE